MPPFPHFHECGPVEAEPVGGCRGKTQLPGLIDRYMDGEILVDELVTGLIPLEKINEAFEHMHTDSGYRYVVQF